MSVDSIAARAEAESEARRQRFVRLACAIIAGSSLAYLAALPWLAPGAPFRALAPLLFFLVCASVFALQSRIGAQPAGLLFSYGLFAATLFIGFGGGVHTPAIYSLPILIGLSAWLTGPRHAVIIALLAMAGTLGLTVAEVNGALIPRAPLPPYAAWVALVALLTIAAILAVIVQRAFQLQLGQLSSMSEALASRVEELDAEKSQLRLVAESVPVMLFHGDSQERCLYANSNYAAFYAAKRENMVGLTVHEILGDEAYALAGGNMARVLSGERLTYRAIRKSSSGEDRILDVDLVPESDNTGLTRGFFALIKDVTEQVHAEEELRRSEEKFAGVFRASPLAIAITRLEDGRYLDVNEAFERLFGLRREEVIGRTSLEIGAWLTPEEREHWVKSLKQTGRLSNREVPFRVSNGDIREGLLSAELINLEGEPCALVLAADITERKRAEEKFAKVFHASPVAISIARLKDGYMLDANDAFVEQFGWSRGEIIGRTTLELGLWPGVEARQHWIDEIGRADRTRNLEVLLNTKSGAQCAALISTERIAFDGEECLLCLIHDVTDRKKKEDEARIRTVDLEKRVGERTAELTSANKELESFAYSISHDLRAPLRGIDGFSHLLAEEYGEQLDAQGKGYLERVRAAAQRMGTLIDDILELSRVTRHSMRRSQVDLSRLAKEILEEQAHSAPERALEVAIAPDCTAFGDPQLLRVMMQNLLENAWKYTGKEAAPRIEFGRETQGGEQVFFVRDNGVGFDMKYADRLFAPFQRLHKPEEFAGTGIGLATVARVVRRHGGRVWAESAPGNGATLRFTLGSSSDKAQ